MSLDTLDVTSWKKKSFAIFLRGREKYGKTNFQYRCKIIEGCFETNILIVDVTNKNIVRGLIVLLILIFI